MRGSRGCGRRAGEFLRIPRSDACFGACLRPFAAEVCGLEYELIAYAEKLFQILCNRFEYGTSQRQHQRTFHLRLARRDFDNHHAVHFLHVVPENLLGCAKAATGRVQEVEECRFVSDFGPPLVPFPPRALPSGNAAKTFANCSGVMYSPAASESSGIGKYGIWSCDRIFSRPASLNIARRTTSSRRMVGPVTT